MPFIWTDSRDRRVLIAVLAAHPELKLDYAKIAALMRDTTWSAVEHRFRVLKKEAKQMSSEYVNKQPIFAPIGLHSQH